MHNGGLDYFRLLAAFGIVLFHSGAPGAAIGYAGLPYFLLMLSLFGLQSASDRPAKEFIADRARRLLLPWLIWSGIYGGLKVVEVMVTGASIASEFHWWMLITGTALHLWFLPFAFVFSLTLPSFAKFWSAASPLTQNAINALLLLATLFMLMGWTNFSLAGPPYAQWAYAIPSALLGLLIGANWPRPHRRAIVTMACIVLLGIAIFIMRADGSLQLAVAVCAMLLCLYMPLPDSWAANVCAKTAMTVYLVHPLIMSVLQRGIHIPPDSLMLALCTVIISFIVAATPMVLAKQRSSH
jgi:peptidoglycan/LPS O-acetylase OafA/YrhL